MNGYVYDSGPSLVSVRNQTYSVKAIEDVNPKNILKSVIDDDPDSNLIDSDVDSDISNIIKSGDDIDIYDEPERISILKESTNYSYDSSDIGSIIHVDSNKKIYIPIEISEKDLLGDVSDNNYFRLETGTIEEILNPKKENKINAPDKILVERALSNVVRDKLPDDMFGLPELRKFPLNDRKHVNQAIRFFNTVETEKDQKTLAANIVKRYEFFNMNTKISKVNHLYNFIPDKMKQKPLNESIISSPDINKNVSQIEDKMYVPIYVILSSNKTVVGDTIRKVTNAKYNHAGLSFDHNLDTIYSFNSEGFVIESISSGPFSQLVKKGSEYSLYVTFILKDNAKVMEDHIKNLIDNMNSTKYNTIGLIKYLLKIPERKYNEYHQFCSEFVTNMFKFVNQSIVSTDASLTSPVDIINNSTKFAYVSKGLLTKYSPKNTLKRLQKIITSRKIHNYLIENSIFYNNLFYNIDLKDFINSNKKYDIFDYFYPSVKYGLVNQMRSSIGGLYLSSNLDDVSNYEELSELIAAFYNPENNRYKVSTNINDSNGDTPLDCMHIAYCKGLYDIVNKMLHNECLTIAQLSYSEKSIIADWHQFVSYHLSIYNDELTSDREKEIEKQYLYDLLWDFHDDIEDTYIVNANIFGFLRELNNVIPILETSDLVDPEDTYAYLKNYILTDDIIFLIPAEMKYPILDKQSVHMAMDIINTIDDDYKHDYIIRLNSAYETFNCNFHIPVNHPYAKYAPTKIIDREYYSLNEDYSIGTIPNIGDVSTNVYNTINCYSDNEFVGNPTNVLENTEDLVEKTIKVFAKFYDTEDDLGGQL